MPTITPSLWFDNDLEQAIEFYTALFPNSSIERIDRYTDAGPGRPGEVVSASFFPDGGLESHCGWLKDRFGLSWQVIPDRLDELTGDPDPARAAAATKAMLGMRKIVVAELEAAVAGL